jgi:hypothetical protein
MMSSEFLTLAKEYQATLEKEFVESQKNLKKSHSATFEDYGSLFNKMTEQVKGKLTNLKSKKTSKLSVTLAFNQAKKIRQMESESENDDYGNTLDWEEDTNSDTCSDREELIEFRTDLEITHQHSEPLSIKKNDDISESLNTPASTLTSHELDNHFQKELTKATILADFHERYILSTLEKRRQCIPVDSNEARRLWQETVDANPLMALENISRSLLSGDLTSLEPYQTSTSTIKELTFEEQNTPLSHGSRKFANFIPSSTPKLDIDDLLLERMN